MFGGVSIKNDNSCVSGGYIADQIDRFAHDYIKDAYKIKKNLFTIEAYISYELQICDWKDAEMFVMDCDEYDGLYGISIGVRSKTSTKRYVNADLTFKEKDHCYCEIQGK